MVPHVDANRSRPRPQEGRHHRHLRDSTKVRCRGTIPQASHTYRYLDTAYPCLNEKQLGIGETTIGGRDTLRNKEGLFFIEELQRVALERCTTAREAIRLMGQLAKEYGYGDSGECLTVADPNEVWIFEIFGEGPKKKGAVWAAVRIPDDEVSVSANICRIGELHLDDTDHYMASDNVFDVAKRLKLWDGKEPFCFWKAYSGGNYFGEKKNYSVREHFILDALAPSLHLSDTVENLPLSVRPDEKVSVERVMQLLGSYYEGTRGRQHRIARVEPLDAPRRNQHVLRHGGLDDEKHPHRQRALVRLQHRHTVALMAAQ